MDRGKLLLGCYRRELAADPERWAEAIGLVLTDFPRSIVEWATDPRSGIQTDDRFKSFPPNSGEVKAYCQAEVERLARAERDALRPKPKHRPYTPPARYPGSRANVFVPADNPIYETLVAWARGKEAKEEDWLMGTDRAGIFVSLHAIQNMHVIRKTAAPQIVSTEAMRESLMRLAGQVRAKEIDEEDAYGV